MARKPRSKAEIQVQAEDATNVPESAEDWINDIDQALKREKNWRERAEAVVKRYRDERASRDNSSKINILWSNTEVLKAALNARPAKPDIRRRFPDGQRGNSASRYAAETLERAIIYCDDIYDAESPVEDAIEDLLLPGRGVVRVEYEPEIAKDENGEESVGTQRLQYRYVYWKDFCHGLARKWRDVPWVAYRHAMRHGEFQDRFPNQPKLPNAASDYKLEDASGNPLEASDRERFVEVWEVWDKTSKRRLYVARGYRNVLQSDDDPYGLEGFFPNPEPLYSVTTNDGLMPEPEYCQYQDQAIELDEVSERIRVLTGFLRWKGIYDGSVDADNRLQDLAGASDGDFLPYQNWQSLKDKGGIDTAVGFWPMERIIPVLQQLHARQPELIQEIYQVTGISDIIRGSTDPRETKGAQQLKAQFGSMRMQFRQAEVDRFRRALTRMKAEIIAEHFTSDNLAEIASFDLPSRAEQRAFKMQSARLGLNMPMPQPSPAGMAASGAPGLLPVAPPGGPAAAPPVPGAAPQTPPADPKEVARMNGPSWDDVMDILRSDKLRAYRVDIETESTALEDAQQAKQERTEFIIALNDILEKAYIAATNAPMMLPLIKEEVLFAVRSYKVGRVMEQSIEDAFEELISNPPAQPQQGKDNGAEADKAKLEIEKQKAEQSVKVDAAKFGLEKQKAEHAMALANKQFALSVAAQNKQIYDEAAQQMVDAAGAPQDGAMAPPQASPMELMLSGIRELAMTIAAGQQQMAQTIATGQAQQEQAIAALAQSLNAPKRVVRGPDGRAIGVEPVTIQ